MRKQLRKSEIRELQEKVKDCGIELSKKNKIELTNEFVLSNNVPVLFIHEGVYVPTLKSLMNGAKLKQVIVDMGAVKFVVSGADIMRPGIVEIDNSLEKGDFVVIIDENNKKSLAIGQALFDYSELKSQEKGKSVKNLHYVGDSIWNFS